MRVTHRSYVAPLGALIGGKFTLPAQPDNSLTSRSPADPEDVVGGFPYALADAARATAAAHEALPRMARLRIELRLAALRRIDVALRERSADLVIRMERETGRPHWECEREVRALSHRIQFIAGLATDALEERADPVAPGRIQSHPLGVVVVLGPAMLPLATSHQHIITALVAGCTVVWKPSPLTPATAQLYAEIVASADLPAGAFNMVQGGEDVGAALLDAAHVEAVVFTGSYHNGLRVAQRTEAAMRQRHLLFLGAKNPAVVTAGAPVEIAAYEIATSAFLSAGQRCTALSRVYVQRTVIDELVSKIVRICRSFRVGPPRGNPFYGPMLDQARMDRFVAAVAAGRADGAEPILTGERLERPGWFLTPSVHLCATRHSGTPYLDDELFGPDLAIHPVDDLDQALDLCEQGQSGLCAALFSTDSTEGARFASRVRAGIQLLNRGSQAVSARMPFGGVKVSGYAGRTGIDAIRAMRRESSVQMRRIGDPVDVFPGTTPATDEPEPLST